MSDAPQTRRLPLRRVIWGAVSLPWEHRVAVFRATAIPLLVVIAGSLASNIEIPSPSLAVRLAFSACYGLALCALAIAVHRLVLLETPEPSARFDSQSLRRLAIFFAWAVCVWVLYWTLSMLITIGVLNVLHPPRYIAVTDPANVPAPEPMPASIDRIVEVARFLAYWVIARVILLFPAIAIDGNADVKAAWQASKRNGWRLAVVVGVLPWSLQQLTDFLCRDGGTIAEYGVIVVLAALFIIIEVAALSLSYWELTTPAPPPTDPPA